MKRILLAIGLGVASCGLIVVMHFWPILNMLFVMAGGLFFVGWLFWNIAGMLVDFDSGK